MRNSWGARLSNQPHRRPPVSPSPFQKKNPQRDRSTSALVSTAAHPPAPRLPQTLNIQHLTLCLCSWVQTQQISKPKTFFFLCYTFDLCVLSIQQQVVVERYRLLTLKAAWVIGWRTSVSGPPLTDEGAFYMGSTLNIVQVLHVGHCLWP